MSDKARRFRRGRCPDCGKDVAVTLQGHTVAHGCGSDGHYTKHRQATAVYDPNSRVRRAWQWLVGWRIVRVRR